MTCITEVLLFLSPLLLLLNQVRSEKPTDEFRAEGENFVMGYCFGVDYIVVYKTTQEGDKLLGNSSNIHLLKTLPADLQGRVHFNEEQLLGLRITNVTELDSGIYRRECWDNHSLVSQHTKQLTVCRREISPEEIVVNEEGGAELLCNSSSIGQGGVSVRWYHETYQVDNPVLFLDSSISLEPLIQDEQGAVEVRNNGAVLVLDKTMLKSNLQFYCLVIEGESCSSFQNMYQADSSETRYSYASEGDRVVLQCNADGDQQEWETPLGKINSSSTRNNQMYISTAESDFSLIISVVANEHSGMYSCISSSLEIQYSLLLCPRTTPLDKVAYKGENVSLECRFFHDASHKVLWYRHASGRDEIFSDSDDHSVPVPEALRGRLTLSHHEYMLNISDLDMKDAGVYGCVLLPSPGFINGDDDDEDYSDYDDEDTAGDYYSNNGFFEDSERCIFKQETVLNVFARRNNDGNQPTANPPESPNGVAVVAVVVALVVIVVVVVVIVKIVKNKKKTDSGAPDVEMKEITGSRGRSNDNSVL